MKFANKDIHVLKEPFIINMIDHINEPNNKTVNKKAQIECDKEDNQFADEAQDLLVKQLDKTMKILKVEVENVKSSVEQQIKTFEERGIKLESLEEKSRKLVENTLQLEKTTNFVKKKQMRKLSYIKYVIAFSLLVVSILVLIIFLKN